MLTADAYRRDAADREADVGAGDVSLPVGLHREGRRHREGPRRRQPEFTTCFGAPFLPRHPTVYGNLLRELIAVHNVDCWLVNTGWTAGKYGVGRRMPIKVTRTLLTAALDGSLRNAKFRTDPYFGFSVPTSVPGIEPHLLYPFKTWQNKAESTRPRASWSRCSRRTSCSSRRRSTPTCATPSRKCASPRSSDSRNSSRMSEATSGDYPACRFAHAVISAPVLPFFSAGPRFREDERATG